MLRFPWFVVVVASVFSVRNPSSQAFLTSQTPGKQCNTPTRSFLVTLHADAGNNNAAARNGKAEPATSTQTADRRDGLVLALQSEIASLYANLAEQKEAHQGTLMRLQRQADDNVQQAQRAVDAIQEEYSAYKLEITRKLENAATPAEVARLEADVESAQEHAAVLKEKLDDALAQLRQNREDRKNLMGEMVALKESYIDKLNELEDQLEFVQDERVRDQQNTANRITALERESKQKIQQAIDEGRKQVDELTLSFTKQIALKDEQVATSKLELAHVRQSMQEKDEAIERLEADAQSVRKLLRKSVGLVKRRIGRRLRSVVPGKNNRA